MGKAFDNKFGDRFLEDVPRAPGIYRFFNARGDLVYVGKAKDLRRRLGQYRNAKRKKAHRKLRRIVKASSRLEFEETLSEKQALLLENELIQSHRPRYNVDGAYAFLYPTIGVKRCRRHLHLVYTTQADDLVRHGFRRFGCYRNRGVTRSAFDSLVGLMSWLGHMEGAPEHLPYTMWRRFRQIPANLDHELDELLLGESDQFLGSVILLLVDKPAARRDRAEVQGAIEALKVFFDSEGHRLKTLRVRSGRQYVPQEQRDRAAIHAEFPEDEG